MLCLNPQPQTVDRRCSALTSKNPYNANLVEQTEMHVLTLSLAQVQEKKQGIASQLKEAISAKQEENSSLKEQLIEFQQQQVAAEPISLWPVYV